MNTMIKAMFAAAVAATGMVSALADSVEIEIVSADRETGEYTLRLPTAKKDLQLYFVSVKAREGDSALDRGNWRNPRFLQTVPAGTSELTVCVPEEKSRIYGSFFLADPERATVRRVKYLIGGKKDNGAFDSAFLTGLHPNRDWRYEIVFSVPEFSDVNQGWLFCHRDSGSSLHSVIALGVKGTAAGSESRRLRFGFGPNTHPADVDRQTQNGISAGVVYQASINGPTCVYSNLTEGIEFETVQAGEYARDFDANFNLGFGGVVNGSTLGHGECSFAQVYSFKVWNGSGELVADYYPVVQDSVAGYFDIVTQKLFKSGDGVADPSAFLPYIASEETLPVDTLVSHLGEPVAVSPVVVYAGALVLCESESKPFSDGAFPAYGEHLVGEDDSITLEIPANEFLWTDEATMDTYRVRSTGLRVDTIDGKTGGFVKGVPQWGVTSYTYERRASDAAPVRVVCLWDAALAGPEVRLAKCLRLVSVGEGENGRTKVDDGPFDTGVHPIPAKTRVVFDYRPSLDDMATQKAKSPVGERRFFGIRDVDAQGYLFQICRTGNGDQFRVDICQESVLKIEDNCLYHFDVSGNRTVIVDEEGNSHEYLPRVAPDPNEMWGTLHIFGQLRRDSSPQLCVDYDNARYYSYKIWQDGETLTRDYVPCVTPSNTPAFFDRVSQSLIHPRGDKAVYAAEFGEDADVYSVCVTGENNAGESAKYYDPDATPLGLHVVRSGESKTFTATDRKVFGIRVAGYRIDTWTESGWAKGEVQNGRSVTLTGEASVRRLVWIWKDLRGLIILFC